MRPAQQGLPFISLAMSSWTWHCRRAAAINRGLFVDWFYLYRINYGLLPFLKMGIVIHKYK